MFFSKYSYYNIVFKKNCPNGHFYKFTSILTEGESIRYRILRMRRFFRHCDTFFGGMLLPSKDCPNAISYKFS